MAKTTNQPNSRLQELDALRGLAALMVLYYHYTSHYRLNYGHIFPSHFDFDLGKHGVSFFFLISGFVILMSVEKVKGPTDFLFKRFTRLYPVYWFCLILTFCSVHLVGLRGKETSFQEALIGLTMIQDLFNVSHVDESYWSLLPELQFYFFIAIVLLIRKSKYVIHFAIAWVILTTASSIFPIEGLPSFYKFRFNVLFLSGMLFYQIWKGKEGLINHILIILCFILWALVIKEPGVILISAVFFILMYFICYKEIRFLKHQFFLFLGRISYSLYLLHQFLGYIIMNALKPHFGSSWVIMIGVPFISMLLLSWLVSKYIEYPSIKISRNLLKKTKLNPNTMSL